MNLKAKESSEERRPTSKNCRQVIRVRVSGRRAGQGSSSAEIGVAKLGSALLFNLDQNDYWTIFSPLSF